MNTTIGTRLTTIAHPYLTYLIHISPLPPLPPLPPPPGPLSKPQGKSALPRKRRQWRRDKAKRYECSACGYKEYYKSDVEAHIRRTKNHVPNRDFAMNMEPAAGAMGDVAEAASTPASLESGNSPSAAVAAAVVTNPAPHARGTPTLLQSKPSQLLPAITQIIPTPKSTMRMFGISANI